MKLKLQSKYLNIVIPNIFTFFLPGEYLVEKIRDSAGQKGTGKWTAISALDYGIPVTLIGESVFARCLSSLKEERVEASKVLPGPSTVQFAGALEEFIGHISKVGE